MNTITPTAVGSAACRVLFGGSATGIDFTDGRQALRVALPVLAGVNSEEILPAAEEPIERDGCTLFPTRALAGGNCRRRLWRGARGGDQRGLSPAFRGDSRSAPLSDLELRAANRRSRAGRENYHRFCRGRSLAFEEYFGKNFQRMLPAASAVGAVAGPFAIGFIAGQAEPRHFENPRQVPAFEYPPEYGPRPPSFSRATVVSQGGAQRTFISGTAAIRGHATVAMQDLRGPAGLHFGEPAFDRNRDRGGPQAGAARWQPAHVQGLRAPCGRSRAGAGETRSRIAASRRHRVLLAGGHLPQRSAGGDRGLLASGA